MITVSAKALWWGDDAWAAPMYLGEIDGWGYITDQFSLLPVARLAELPVGYGHVLNLKPLPLQALEGFGLWLTATVLHCPSQRLFAGRVIDPLEKAGFVVRPLEGVKDAHGVCDPDMSLVGLVIPVRRSAEVDAAKGARVAA